jgi:prevent-host-death family protein
MTKVPATDFKARCLELMDRVAARGESFVITKRGKPVARLVPLPRKADDSLFACLAGKATISGDITSPAIAAEAWEAAREWDALEHGETTPHGRDRRRRAARSRSRR